MNSIGNLFAFYSSVIFLKYTLMVQPPYIKIPSNPKMREYFQQKKRESFHFRAISHLPIVVPSDSHHQGRSSARAIICTRAHAEEEALWVRQHKPPRESLHCLRRPTPLLSYDLSQHQCIHSPVTCVSCSSSFF